MHTRGRWKTEREKGGEGTSRATRKPSVPERNANRGLYSTTYVIQRGAREKKNNGGRQGRCPATTKPQPASPTTPLLLDMLDDAGIPGTCAPAGGEWEERQESNVATIESYYDSTNEVENDHLLHSMERGMETLE
jgi:peptidoglycan/xylan/chitin deacetylase (PgdA/CDA1 family)